MSKTVLMLFLKSSFRIQNAGNKEKACASKTGYSSALTFDCGFNLCIVSEFGYI